MSFYMYYHMMHNMLTFHIRCILLGNYDRISLYILRRRMFGILFHTTRNMNDHNHCHNQHCIP